MERTFFIVGQTATGKSDLAADVASEIGAEIVSADAFQIYRGLDLLTAKPDASTLAKAPHHLIGTVETYEEMNAEKFRQAALNAIAEIKSRGNPVLIVGGSGLYVRALTHGLFPLPKPDPKLRAKLNTLSLDKLHEKIFRLDPETALNIDSKNRRRLIRAIEICLTTGKPLSAVAGVVDPAGAGQMIPARGVFVFRDRDELKQRINSRVSAMFDNGVIEEVRGAGAISQTASQMIGLHEIRQLLEGKMSILESVAAIQQATRRY